MTSQVAPPQPGKINFAGMVGAKRRRMRSGGNVSTLTNNAAKDTGVNGMDEEKTAQTSKCKGATTIPIFLKSKSTVRCFRDLDTLQRVAAEELATMDY